MFATDPVSTDITQMTRTPEQELQDMGGEPLKGSGFEDEIPDASAPDLPAPENP